MLIFIKSMSPIIYVPRFAVASTVFGSRNQNDKYFDHKNVGNAVCLINEFNRKDGPGGLVISIRFERWVG